MTRNGSKYAFGEMVLGCETFIARSSKILLDVSFSWLS